MMPGDEQPPVPPADDGDDGEELPPPVTWAGRRRSGDENDEPAATEPEAGEGDGEEPAEAGEEELREGFTEEYDQIERELDSELEDLEPESAEQSLPQDAGEAASGELDSLDAEEDLDRIDDEEELAEAGEAAAGGAPDAEAGEAGEPEAGATVEADTLSLADREQAEEAALAALRARSAAAGAGPVPPPTAPPPEPEPEPEADAAPEPVAVAAVAADADEKPGRAKPVWLRFLAASLVIVSSMAAATAITGFVFFADLSKGFGGIDGVANQLDEIDGGDPQTILILGSDKRPDEDSGRSDTTMLLHVDPDADTLSLLSIPRDLKVRIPKYGVDKFNAAYSVNGPSLTLKTVKRLTGLPIHHVVNVNFTGFADAVDAINCVFIDVDRQYYVPEGTFIDGSQYSAIDPPINAGYQKLCGLRALQYVRYRIGDNDLVRSARQQDFVREARQKIEPGRLLTDVSYRNELLDVFKEHTTSDEGLKEPSEVIELMRTFLGASDAVLNEVQFPAQLGTTYVTHDDESLKQAIDEFLDGPPEPGGGDSDGGDGDGGDGKDGGGKDGGGDKKDKPDKPEPDPEPAPEGPGVVEDAQSEQYARQIADWKTKGGKPMIKFPVYYPTALAPMTTVTDESRAFPIDGPREYRGYKLVMEVPGEPDSGLQQEYYGVSGTNWVDPPILENPAEVREIDGRDYLMFYDGDRLRLIGWKSGKASYWVNNTLLQSLEVGQMIEIAKSMRELGG